MKRKVQSRNANGSEHAVTGSWQSFNGGRILQLVIAKPEPITEFEFDEMLEMITTDLRKAYLEKRFRPEKKLLES